MSRTPGTTKEETTRVEFQELFLRVEEDVYERVIRVRYRNWYGRTKWMEVRRELVTWEIPG